ncbi:MAG: glycosyltransferase family 9 protein, partial [Granulicella sp.]
AMQTPCVAIFSARGKPRTWFPYGRQHRVVYHRVECWGCGLETCVVEKKRCLTSIGVEEVLVEVRTVLEGVG